MLPSAPNADHHRAEAAGGVVAVGRRARTLSSASRRRRRIGTASRTVVTDPAHELLHHPVTPLVPQRNRPFAVLAVLSSRSAALRLASQFPPHREETWRRGLSKEPPMKRVGAPLRSDHKDISTLHPSTSGPQPLVTLDRIRQMSKPLRTVPDRVELGRQRDGYEAVRGDRRPRRLQPLRACRASVCRRIRLLRPGPQPACCVQHISRRRRTSVIRPRARAEKLRASSRGAKIILQPHEDVRRLRVKARSCRGTPSPQDRSKTVRSLHSSRRMPTPRRTDHRSGRSPHAPSGSRARRRSPLERTDSSSRSPLMPCVPCKSLTIIISQPSTGLNHPRTER